MMRLKQVIFNSGLLVWISSALPCVGAGVAALKDQPFHLDSAARLVVYNDVIISRGPYIKIVTGQKELNIERSKLVDRVDVPGALPPTIISEADLSPIRASHAEMSAFSKRFTKSAAILEPHIAALTGQIANFESGQIRYDGIWISQMDFAKLQARENQELKKTRLKHEGLLQEKLRIKEEDLAFAKNQRELGLEFDGENWVPKDSMITMPPAPTSDLSVEIAPLRKPDIDSARMAVTNLTVLAARQRGAEKVRTERLLAVIRNLFTAEFQVTEQFNASARAKLEAARHQKNARNWLVPNAFGTVNEVAARESQMKAAEVVEKADQKLALRQQNLLDHLQETDSVTHDFYKLQDFGVVLMLAESVQTISRRSLPPNVFSSTFSERAIAEVRDLIRGRHEWLASARNAETAGNFEEAMLLYSKARDLVGRRRCALSLARILEEGELYGSAIDYYEIAGDFKRAALIRKLNPYLLLDSYRKLNSEDLFAKISPSCVRVANGNGHGSGFFFRPGGYILTNHHVVEDEGAIAVKFDDGRTFEAKLIEKSDKLDLAIIRIPMDKHDVINFRIGEEVRIGTPVVLIGYPQVDLPTATMNSGIVSNTDRVAFDNPVYQLDVSANHGNSGGPVVDEAGRLVGILTFGQAHLERDRFNFAITAAAVNDFVKDAMGD